MIAVLGLIILAAAVVSFWSLLPRHGNVHRLATAQFLESIIPIGIVMGLAMGLGMILPVFTGEAPMASPNDEGLAARGGHRPADVLVVRLLVRSASAYVQR